MWWTELHPHNVHPARPCSARGMAGAGRPIGTLDSSNSSSGRRAIKQHTSTPLAGVHAQPWARIIGQEVTGPAPAACLLLQNADCAQPECQQPIGLPAAEQEQLGGRAVVGACSRCQADVDRRQHMQSLPAADHDAVLALQVCQVLVRVTHAGQDSLAVVLDAGTDSLHCTRHQAHNLVVSTCRAKHAAVSSLANTPACLVSRSWAAGRC